MKQLRYGVLVLYCMMLYSQADAATPYQDRYFRFDLPDGYDILPSLQPKAVTLERTDHTCRIYLQIFTTLADHAEMIASMQFYMADADPQFQTIPIAADTLLHYDVPQIRNPHIETMYVLPAKAMMMYEILGTLSNGETLYIMSRVPDSAKSDWVVAFMSLLETLQIME